MKGFHDVCVSKSCHSENYTERQKKVFIWVINTISFTLSKFYINDIALDWCKSYLLNMPQHVCIGNAVSKPVILDYSVPQGSVLGPQWFTVYTSPVRDIILKYNLNYHVYADDTHYFQIFSRTC